MNKFTSLAAVSCTAFGIVFSAAAADENGRPGATGLADVYSRPLSVVEQGSTMPPAPRMKEIDATGVAEISHYTPRKGNVAEATVKSLDSMIVANFPRDSVTTVGDAARHLVARAGYTLKSASLDRDGLRALAARLPPAQRTIGPDQVRMLLLEVVGPGIEPVVDNAARTVTLVSRPEAKVRRAPDPSLTNALPEVAPTPQ